MYYSKTLEWSSFPLLVGRCRRLVRSRYRHSRMLIIWAEDGIRFSWTHCNHCCIDVLLSIDTRSIFVVLEQSNAFQWSDQRRLLTGNGENASSVLYLPQQWLQQKLQQQPKPQRQQQPPPKQQHVPIHRTVKRIFFQRGIRANVSEYSRKECIQTVEQESEEEDSIFTIIHSTHSISS